MSTNVLNLFIGSSQISGWGLYVCLLVDSPGLSTVVFFLYQFFFSICHQFLLLLLLDSLP